MLLVIFICLAIVFATSIAFDNEVGMFISSITMGTFIIIFIGSCYQHSSDLSLIRLGSPLIEIREEAIEDIDKQLNKLKFSQTSLMNNDSPAKSLIETKSKYISELTLEKLKIQQARIDIEARSIGLFKFIVWWFGKE